MEIDFLGFGGITVVCYLCAMIVKATPLDSRWIPVFCGILGGILGAIAFLFIPLFPAQNVLSAAAEGIVSGLAATGANQVYKQLTQEENG